MDKSSIYLEADYFLADFDKKRIYVSKKIPKANLNIQLEKCPMNQMESAYVVAFYVKKLSK